MLGMGSERLVLADQPVAQSLLCEVTGIDLSDRARDAGA
jgi:hypothetical protein